MADALAKQIAGSQPKTAAEGIGAIIKGAAAGYGRYQTDKAEGEKTKAASEIFNSIIGGGKPSSDGGASDYLAPGAGQSAPQNQMQQGQSMGGQAQGRVPPEQIQALIQKNVPPELQDYATNLIGKESSFNPNAVSPTGATGLAQFTKGTGRQYGLVTDQGDMRSDPEANLRAMVALTNDNREILRKGLGREPSNPELALAHQQGAAGALKLLSGQGVDPRNLAVNGVAPGTDPRAAAQKIMAYYGGGQQVASLGGGAGMPQAAPQNASGAIAQQMAPQQQPSQPTGPQPSQNQQMQPLAPPRNVGAAPGMNTPQQAPQAQQQGQALQQPQQMAQASGPDPRILQALANPWTSPEQKQVLQMMLQQQMQSADPGRNLDLQIKQQELRQMQSPQQQYRVLNAEERQQYGIPQSDSRVYQVGPNGQIGAVGGAGQTINVGGDIDARRQAATALGLPEDDPRYKSYVLTGKMPREDAQPLTATDKKAVLEADEMVSTASGVLPMLEQAKKLNEKAYSGPFAGTRGYIAGTFGAEGGNATLDYDNLVQTQALQQMKTIFGAAPTEGERKILLDISGSSNLPPEVRKGILDRAQQAVQRRLDLYQNRADELRGGTFYKPSGQDGQRPTAPKAKTIGGYTIEEVQ
ncbi:lytic transglycosylase domain-containing protein [Agrobacterium vitis]|nr:lytic transglycosylase domain-containing protein [Agrobacterium vitis]